MLHIQRAISCFVNGATDSINKSEKISKREIKNLKLEDLGQDLDLTPEPQTEAKEEPNAITLASELSSTSIEFIKDMGFVRLAEKLTERFGEVKDSWGQKESLKTAQWKELKAELEDIKKEIESEKGELDELVHTMQPAAALSETSQAWQESGVEVTRDLGTELQEIEEAKVGIGYFPAQAEQLGSTKNRDGDCEAIGVEDSWGDTQSELRTEIFKKVLKIRQEWHSGSEEDYVHSVKELCVKLRPVKGVEKDFAHMWHSCIKMGQYVSHGVSTLVFGSTEIVKHYENTIDSFMSLGIEEKREATYVLSVVGVRLLDPTEFDQYTIDNILEKQ
jgi:hypothetical protein